MHGVDHHSQAPKAEAGGSSPADPFGDIPEDGRQQQRAASRTLDPAVREKQLAGDRDAALDEAVIVGVVGARAHLRECPAADRADRTRDSKVPQLECADTCRMPQCDAHDTQANNVPPGHAVELLPVAEQTVCPLDARPLGRGLALQHLVLLGKVHAGRQIKVDDHCDEREQP